MGKGAYSSYVFTGHSNEVVTDRIWDALQERYVTLRLSFALLWVGCCSEGQRKGNALMRFVDIHCSEECHCHCQTL